MSLNGLDSARITDAFQSAVAEAGGWFLLNYVSRDEVDLYARGHGGITELRSATTQYLDKSPLYGFLLYRRRKVLVKYIPEGTSRLLQARVTVHFQAITERFTPFDSILNVTTAEGLNDSALALAFPLHTASPSNSSSRLHEIAEDGEDGQIVANRTDSPSVVTISEKPVIESADELASSNQHDTPAISVSGEKTSILLRANTVGSKIVVSEEDIKTPMTPESTVEPPSTISIPRHSMDHPRTDIAKDLKDPPRMSSQSERIDTSDLFDPSLYGFKKKVKLGPRPSLDPGKRSNASASARSTEGNRPISTLPAGLKMFPKRQSENSKGSKESSRPKTSSEKPKSAGLVIPVPPPIPDFPDISPTSPRITSRNSVKSMPISTKPSSMTPEKKRLMKALELRKKQMATAKNTNEEKATEITGRDEALPAQLPGSLEQALNRERGDTFGSGFKADSGIDMDGGEGPATVANEKVEVSRPDLDVDMPSENSNPPNGGAQREDQNSNEQTSLETPHDSGAELGLEKVSSATDPGILNEEEIDDSALEDTDGLENEDTSSETTLNFNPPKLALKTSDNDMAGNNLRQKRRGVVEPIQINISTEDSEAEYLSDDSFMEELQSAKVEKATSLSVSKSPATPIFRRRPSSNSANSGTPRPGSYVSSDKNESLVLRDGTQSPPERANSFTFEQKAQEAANISRQRTVSSGISKRIQALEEHSHRPGPPPGTFPAINTDSSKPFLAMRKSSIRSPAPTAARSSMVSSPPIRRGPSVKSPGRANSRDEGQTTYNVHQHGRTESISVTARIVRDPQSDQLEILSPKDRTPLELYHSPLIINHQKVGDSPTKLPMHNVASTSPPPIPNKNTSRTEAIPPLPSESSNRDTLSTAPSRTSESGWRNLGHSRQSHDLKSPPATARSQSNSSHASDDKNVDDNNDGVAGKRKSRTSRLFKRMSNSMSMTTANIHRRRSLAAGSPTAQTLADAKRPAMPEPAKPPADETMPGSGDRSSAVEVGDLNVQFPDNLLWKRRWVEINDQGFLVLSMNKASEHQKNIVKKYHLSEFKRPFAPDQDRQELPNSVVLDFREGSTLQCACEDHYRQTHVLKAPMEPWIHASFKAYNFNVFSSLHYTYFLIDRTGVFVPLFRMFQSEITSEWRLEGLPDSSFGHRANGGTIFICYDRDATIFYLNFTLLTMAGVAANSGLPKHNDTVRGKTFTIALQGHYNMYLFRE
ncbi:MAG: hypothetical protein M1820_001020 [Bogoriella megaspora]|nr:MAG: hypothetical protein M1820_001020 [Bogoriella megaspora]